MKISNKRVCAVLGAAAVMVVGGPRTAEAAEPSGLAFGRTCAMVTLLAIPGSNETSEAAGFDVAQAMLANVTNAITTRSGPSIRTHYLGYPAQLFPYEQSRGSGYQAAWSTVNYYATQCPTTSFILLGYSQGAHIAGDLAATIGKQSSPVAANRVRSVRLLADPARDPRRSVIGSGGRGGGFFGWRGDFKDLNGRVAEYCNADDGFCNASLSAFGESLTSKFAAHTSYQNQFIPGSTETYTTRVSNDLIQDIVNLNDATF